VRAGGLTRAVPAAGAQVPEGVVLEVGPGARAADGTLVPPGVAVGDKVMLPEFGGTGVDLGDDRELVVFRSDELLGVLQ